MVIDDLCTVKMHYTLRLDDGDVLESTTQGAPFEFVFGSGRIIPGLERELRGMAQGEEKHIVVLPEDAYGAHDPNAVVNIPRGEFPVEDELKPGMIFRLTRENGMVIHAVVVETGDDVVTLDMNHPLAGKKLHFEVKIEEITAP